MFIAAGVERLEQELDVQRWLQVNIELAPHVGAHRILAPRVARKIERCLKQRAIRHFFFVSKPPGLRLRFCGRRLGRTVQKELMMWLEGLKGRRAIADYKFGVYDGESYQFGGEVGLELFHEFSTYDSLTILGLGLLQPRTRRRIDVGWLTLLMMSSLMRSVTTDAWELWDIWCNMRLAGRHLETAGKATVDSSNENRKIIRELTFRPEKALRALDKADRALVRRYFALNRRLGEKLIRAERSGQLLYGLRKILPFYAVFHWNRLLLSIDMQRELVFLMETALNPKRDPVQCVR
jgi:thiopeptide-type bacteriocin biosynthesis protein